MYSRDIRSKIVDNVDIVEELSKSIDLNPKGRNYEGLCPFHADNNPSFTVSSEKRIYKCFVCGEGGDVVTFNSKINHISQTAAIEKLAKSYGISIPKLEPEVKLSPQAYVVLDINKFYVTALHSTEGGNKAIAYLHKRGITSETINHFHLGYGYEENGALYEYLLAKAKSEGNYTINDIQSLNHFSNGRDLMTSRVTIPITKEGKFVGFGGRDIGSNSVKYLNSKDSSLFRKNEILFNFEEAIKLSPDKSLVIVEGFFDVITAHQYGIKNAVGLMGTAFTSNHIRFLKQRRIDTIYLSLDSDNAGKQATYKVGRVLQKNGIVVKVIEYDDVKDLDEFLNKYEFADFEQKRKTANNYKLFEVDYMLGQSTSLSIDEKDNLIDLLLENLSNERDLVIEEVLTKMETSLSVTRSFLETKLKKIEESSSQSYNQNANQSYTQSESQSFDSDMSYDYYIPEMDDSLGEQYYSQDDSINEVKPLTSNSHVSFLTTNEAVIYRALNSRDAQIELAMYIEKHKKKLGIYHQVFDALGEYYKNNQIFDYVTFANNYYVYANIITEILEKEVKSNELSNEQLVKRIKGSNGWGIFR